MYCIKTLLLPYVCLHLCIPYLLSLFQLQIEKMLELEQEVRKLSAYVSKLEHEKETLQHHLRSEEYSHATEVMTFHQQQQEANVLLRQQVWALVPLLGGQGSSVARSCNSSSSSCFKACLVLGTI